MKGVKIEYKTEINALLEYEGFFRHESEKLIDKRYVVTEDYIYSSYITMQTRDEFLGNKLVYRDTFRILKEVNIDGKYYILTMNVFVVDGKLFSSSYCLVEGDLGSFDLDGEIEAKIYKALDIFLSGIVRINRAMVDGDMHIEDYKNFFKSLDTIVYIDTNSKFFQG